MVVGHTSVMSPRTIAIPAGLAAAAVAAHAARYYLWVPASLRHPSLLAPLPVRGRRSLALVRRLFSAPGVPVPGVEVTSVQVPGPGGTTVPVLRHESPARRRPSGALLWLHGGGYVAGTAAGSTAYCSTVAARLGIPVYAVDYRLAPEHPFPAALDDAYAALRWLRSRAGDLGVDPDRIAVGGASAGGGLAAALCQRARDGDVPVRFQLLRYPMLDDRTRRQRGWRRDAWTPASNRFGWRSYLGGRSDRAQPPRYAVPARTPDLTGLPPAWIGVGAGDIFHDEDERYAADLAAAGVPVDLRVEPGMYHGADGVVPDAPQMQAFTAAEIAALGAALER